MLLPETQDSALLVTTACEKTLGQQKGPWIFANKDLKHKTILRTKTDVPPSQNKLQNHI